MLNKTISVSIIVGVVAMSIAAGGAWRAHEEPATCGLCHIIRPYYESWESSTLLDHAHAEENVECLDCHDASVSTMVSEFLTYVSGEYRDPLKQRKFSQGECLKCHEHSDRAELIEITADYDIEYSVSQEFLEKLADRGYDWDAYDVNPHAYVVDPENARNPHESDEGEAECYRCHKSHTESPGIDYCFTCHHSGTLVPCAVCHEQTS